MAVARYPTYGSVGGLKAFLGQSAETENDRLAARLAAASRTFDRFTRRKKGAWSAMDDVRYFDVTAPPVTRRTDLLERLAFDPPVLHVDSLLAVTSLATDNDGDGVFETTWTAADYLLRPYDGPPFRSIAVASGGAYSGFPLGTYVVRIDATWGECEEPDDDVVDIVYLIASRLRARAKSPEGILGDAERGFVRMNEMDPDVAARIEHGGFLDVAVFA